MSRFRKKPVVVDAVQLLWRNWNEICDFLGAAFTAENPTGAWHEGNATCGETGDGIALRVRTIQGQLVTVKHGEWIIAESEPGRFYPCAPDIFETTYDEVLA